MNEAFLRRTLVRSNSLCSMMQLFSLLHYLLHLQKNNHT